MTTIFFYYLLIQLIISIFIKIDKTYLLCGMAGISMKKNLNAVQLAKVQKNMKILGLYNEKRGKQGVGWYINNEIIKGWDSKADDKETAEFNKFIAEEELPAFNLQKSTVSFLHLRQASTGIVSKENNHPFILKYEDKSIIFQHNGTIKNIWELCNKYKLPHNSITVDSVGLGLLIMKQGLSILNEYKGGAALIWSDNKDSFYVYHGSSVTDYTNKVYEERPLYYLETNEGIYFSSLADALKAIKDNKKQKVECLEYNHVFQVKFGEFTNFCHKVTRCDNKETTFYNNNTNFDAFGYNSHTSNKISPPSKIVKTLNENQTISNETLPFDLKEPSKIPDIFFWKNRFWEVIYNQEINDWDFTLAEGEKKVTYNGMINSNAIESYFIKGIKVLKHHYDEALSLYISICIDKNINFAKKMSKYSMYPITNLEDESSNVIDKNLFWNKEALADYTTSVFTTQRTYTFVKGRLKSIESSIPNDNILKSKPAEASHPKFNEKINNSEEYLKSLTDEEIYTIACVIAEELEIAYNTPFDSFDDLWEWIESDVVLAAEREISIFEYLKDEHGRLDFYYNNICNNIDINTQIWEPISNNNFDTMAEVKKTLSKVTDTIKNLLILADELQAIDNDNAQTLAHTLYRKGDEIIANLADNIDGFDGKDFDVLQIELKKLKQLNES